MSFALACATGAPIDPNDTDDSKRSGVSGFNWEPTFENFANHNSQHNFHEKPKETE